MDDFLSNFQDKITGLKELRAEVVSVGVQENLMMAQVRIPGFFDNLNDKQLPWAEYKLPIGFRPNEGSFTPVKVGDRVWVDWYSNEFDPSKLRITGSVHEAPEGVPNFPHEAFGGDDKFDHQRTPNQPEVEEQGYHTGVVYSQNNVLAEVLPGGNFRLTDKVSGTALAIENGKYILHGEGEGFISFVENLLIELSAALTFNIAGNATFTVGGNALVDATGTATVKCKGNAKLESTDGNVDIKSSGSVNIN